MTRKIVFDTLAYARTLKKGGVKCAEVHATSLFEAIVYNIYTKEESDKMIEAILRQLERNRNEDARRFNKSMYEFEKRFQQSERRFQQNMANFKQEMLVIRNDLERQIARSFHSTINVLGALIVVVGAASTLADYFIR